MLIPLAQREDTTIQDHCEKAASSMIVDRLYPDYDENAFNKILSVSSRQLLSGLQALPVAQENP